jgi:hypothetical protein
MKPLTYEAVTHHPELIDALMAQARRERALAFHRLVVLPIKQLFSAGPALELRGVQGRPAQG